MIHMVARCDLVLLGSRKRVYVSGHNLAVSFSRVDVDVCPIAVGALIDVYVSLPYSSSYVLVAKRRKIVVANSNSTFKVIFENKALSVIRRLSSDVVVCAGVVVDVYGFKVKV